MPLSFTVQYPILLLNRFPIMLKFLSDVIQMLIVLVPPLVINIVPSVSPNTMAHTTANGMSGIPLLPPASALSRGSSQADLHLLRATTHNIILLMVWGFSGRGASTEVGGTLQASSWLVGEIGRHGSHSLLHKKHFILLLLVFLL